ncbi:hypothetical protein LY28_01369 [Ruminiclostridium sufflavum DSM 19573]|uniref:CdiA toxin EC869-like domain-containing protein n=1 Tax=Ruminiclostridium sufflavum DSM 19573 TaxID=1121337 RepID=A0A318XZT8_9FIRM|nr:pilus assembly protein TadE [Ruminiclostridium sufflavum]PYG88520.1 hypothetical protein LY28_01369 [Ruminiclostridium sufflavum DSM 19573]
MAIKKAYKTTSVFMAERIAACRGSITIEAAIILPVFIAAFITFVFIVKVYYTHEIIQQAILGACNEISLYGLLYYETDADELVGYLEKICNSQKVSETFGDSSLSSIIGQIGKDTTDYIRAQAVLLPVLKALVEENLEVSRIDTVNDRLRWLNLKNGFSGLDFSESRMLADGKSIDLIVSYEMVFPFLTQFLPEIHLRQMASSCIWAGEEGVKRAEEKTDGAGIWDMSNINRGREIRKLQGANLPFSFPTIAIFSNGKAVSIKSLNTEEAYYKSSDNLKKKLLMYIDKLEKFEGGKSSEITIEGMQVCIRELRLIIPEAELLSNQQQAINECIKTAQGKGINLKVIKAYGRGKAAQGGNTERNPDEVENDTED